MLVIISVLVFLILTTYVLYPFVTIVAGRLITNNDSRPIDEKHRRVFLVMAAHNEEAVINEKLNSILNSNFKGELKCYIGSDASTDRTNDIVISYQSKLDINFEKFTERSGKPAIVNHLVTMINEQNTISNDDLLLLTDSNVIFKEDFIAVLADSFKDEEMGLADGHIVNLKNEQGIGQSESQYLKIESQLKEAEGKLWNCSMGPFGGAFMMRAHLFKPVPNNYLVDDFFIFYHVVNKGYKAIFNKKAICYEAVSGSLSEEFRRKVRISSGNFQNLGYFWKEISQFWKKHNIIFVLHKLLRWLSPLFLIGILVFSILASVQGKLSWNFFVIMISLLVGIPMLNYLLKQVNLSNKYLQGLSYLIIMNVALFIGLIKCLKGIKTNVWKPTKRKVSIKHS